MLWNWDFQFVINWRQQQWFKARFFSRAKVLKINWISINIISFPFGYWQIACVRFSFNVYTWFRYTSGYNVSTTFLLTSMTSETLLRLICLFFHFISWFAKFAVKDNFTILLLSTQMFSILFFFMLFVLGIGSNIAMCTCIITILRDKFKSLKAWQAAVGLSTVGFLFGLIYVTPVSINDWKYTLLFDLNRVACK